MADQDRELMEAAVVALVAWGCTQPPDHELTRQARDLVDQLVLEHSARYGMGIDGPTVGRDVRGGRELLGGW